jgi:hypothetical protein
MSTGFGEKILRVVGDVISVLNKSSLDAGKEGG